MLLTTHSVGVLCWWRRVTAFLLLASVGPARRAHLDRLRGARANGVAASSLRRA